jgi:hypothetical protein
MLEQPIRTASLSHAAVANGRVAAASALPHDSVHSPGAQLARVAVCRARCRATLAVRLVRDLRAPPCRPWRSSARS